MANAGLSMRLVQSRRIECYSPCRPEIEGAGEPARQPHAVPETSRDGDIMGLDPHLSHVRRGWAAAATGKARLKRTRHPSPGSPPPGRRGGAGPEREWRSRSAARLAGDADGPSRERRPLPRLRERPQTRRRARGDDPNRRRAPPALTRNGLPRGAAGSAASNRASRQPAGPVAGQRNRARRPAV